jgi:hypothetical protein
VQILTLTSELVSVFVRNAFLHKHRHKLTIDISSVIFFNCHLVTIINIITINNMSTSPTSMPALSLCTCFVDGTLDIMRYYSYSCRRRQKSERSCILTSLITKKPKTNHSGIKMEKGFKNWSVKKHKVIIRDNE